MKFSLRRVGHRASTTSLAGALAAVVCVLPVGCSDDDGIAIIDPDAGFRPTIPTTAVPDAAPAPSSVSDAAAPQPAPTSEAETSDSPSSDIPSSGTSSSGTAPLSTSEATLESSSSAPGSSETTGDSDDTLGPLDPSTTGDVDTGGTLGPIDPTSTDDAVGESSASEHTSAAVDTDNTGSQVTDIDISLGTSDGDAGLDAGVSGEDSEGDASASDTNTTSAEGGVESLDASTDAGPAIHVATLQELTDVSASDYADNEHGLIDGPRLQQWLTDWELSKPAAIDGRLVILQIVPSGATTQVHISANEASGIYTYLVPANEFNSPRNNGISAFESDIPDGAAVDAWLAKYAIDPRHDFILLTFEDLPSTTNSVVQSVGRGWLFLKYWGVSNEHVGILNGSVNWHAANSGVALSPVADGNFSTPPQNGAVSVRDLGVDATVLSISLEEIIAILHQEPGAPDINGVRIIDARGGAEALGLAKATSTGRTDCASYTGSSPNSKCSTPFEGRIKGAHSVPWTQFLDTRANGFRFLPRDQVKATFDEQAEWDAGAEWTIQYCRTNQRSTVTSIVANVILGYPTRLYETSFIEWGHASTSPGTVAEDFPFRTDLPTLTEHAVLDPDDLAAYNPGGSLGPLTKPVTWVAGPNYNDPADVSPASPEPWPTNPSGWPRLDANAVTTRLAIDTDRAYLRGISIEELDD